jgi:hypothetical protein
VNQIKAYHDGCRLKINRMIKLKNPKKNTKIPTLKKDEKKDKEFNICIFNC